MYRREKTMTFIGGAVNAKVGARGGGWLSRRAAAIAGAALFLSVFMQPSMGLAGEVVVVNAVAGSSGAGYRFDVTLRHADTGWEHYADQWEVLAPDGSVLATRTLYHPHVDEQPFTRSLSGVKIPKGMKSVLIRARDSVHGFGPKLFEVKLPGRS